MKKPREVLSAIGPSIAYVPLTQGAWSLIDSEDVSRVESFCWSLGSKNRPNGHHYARRGVRKEGDSVRFQAMHRFLLNATDFAKIDHRNGNTLDNRRCNLRIASSSQNAHNARLSITSTTGYKGVSRYRNLWRARITVLGKAIFLGNFTSPEDAHEAYCAFGKKVAGDFFRPM